MLLGQSRLGTADRVNTTFVQFQLCKSEQLPLSVLLHSAVDNQNWLCCHCPANGNIILPYLSCKREVTSNGRISGKM